MGQFAAGRACHGDGHLTSAPNSATQYALTLAPLLNQRHQTIMTVFYIILGALGIILLLAIIIKPKEKKPKSYSWDDSLDPICITVDEIANGSSEILVVYHDYGPGGWQFYEGKDVSERNPKVVVKNEILRIDSSMNEIITLETGWKAERKFKGDKWTRSKI